jgi:PAS domain S-box-containing protein
MGQEDIRIIVTLVLGLSILLQLVAAFLALRLIRVTGKRGAWILIAVAVVLMAVRRVLTFQELLSGESARTPDLATEVVALTISALMLAGLALIATLFRAVKESEESVRHSEARARRQFAELEAIYAAAPVGLCFVDTELRFVNINERLAKINGLPVAAHLGRTLREVLPELADDLEPLYRRVIDAGEPILDLEVRGSTPAQPDVKRAWLVSYYPVKGEVGEVLGVNAVVLEITERQRAEEALRQSSTRLEVVNRLHQLISRNLDIREVYEAFVPEMARLVAFDSTAILILDEAAGAREIVARWTRHEPILQPGAPLPLTSSPLVGAIRRAQPYVERELGEMGEGPELERLRREGIRSRAVVPLIIKGKVIGSLALGSRQTGAYSDQDLEVLKPLADQLAIALDNARLFEQVRQQAQELEQRVAERTAALKERVTEVERLNRATANLLEDLQQAHQMTEETARSLEAANAELKSFSYSVSHDLRAPLRAIDGFSQALVEDYADQLDEQGQAYLQRIRTASQRLGQLIDDMLKLARVTRSELHRSEVDLSAQAQAVATELQKARPRRDVELIIAPGLTAQADANLLRIVLENLLGNAWKFTSKQPRARIELGMTYHNGATAYFIRDNGAGFDMAYAGKLFGAFQRLHTATEFEGTGIGLATVQRIIHRHGGRVWAEGVPGQGATFYFTI